MLTNREVVERINRWTKRPRAHVPVCYHNESHGRLRAVLLRGGNIYLSCTRCRFLLDPFGPSANLPETAFRKVA